MFTPDEPVRRAALSTVGSLLDDVARRFPDRIALQDEENVLRYGDLASRTDRLANWLIGQGVGRGDRVALLSENSITYVELMLAAAKVGCILACQNWRLAGPELQHCMDLVEPCLMLASSRHAHALETVAYAAAPRIVLDKAFEDRLADCAMTPPSVDVDPEDPLLILYTSGTTGLPKGAIISHRAEIARNVALRAEFGLAADDTFVAWTPLYHMGGADHSLGALMAGGKVIVCDGFDAEKLASIAVREPVGWFVVMPGTVDRMIAALEAQGRPPDGVKMCGVMADLVPRHEIARLTTLLNAPYVNTFGATETGSPPGAASHIPVGQVPERLSKVQSPYCEVRLVDETGHDVPVGTPGELLMRGATLFSGYWRNEEANRKDFRDGWFHMGDILVRNPNGTLDFVDRAKYLIKSGGENIYPAEIEQVLLTDARVADAAVVRREDAKWGEVPVAFVARHSTTLEAAALYDLCRERLAGYKQPKDIFFIGFDEFPRNASGKILRHELERQLAAEGPCTSA